MSKYEFTEIGNKITESLLQAAEDQVTEANNLLASVKVLAEGITAQMDEHSKMLNDMDERLRDFGLTVLEAHKRLINGSKHENPSP